MKIEDKIKKYLQEETPIFDNFLKIKKETDGSDDNIELEYNNKRTGIVTVRKYKNNIYYLIGLRTLKISKGFGEKIIKYVLKNYKGDIYLHVLRDNFEAIRLYKKFGFKEDNETNEKIPPYRDFPFKRSPYAYLFSKNNKGTA